MWVLKVRCLYSFSGLYGHLGSLVHTNPMVQEYLGPSLLSTYIAVDQIEGLDVDKEEFDKYGARLVGGADMQLVLCNIAKV